MIFGRADEVGLKRQAYFDDWLICPSRKIAVEHGVGNGFLTSHLGTEIFRIRVWRGVPISAQVVIGFDSVNQVVIGFDSVNYVEDCETLWDFPRELFLLRSDPPRRRKRR